MKDSLKEFVDQHREEFDDKTPGEKVWNRISANLPQMKSASLWNSVMLWKVAAVLFMGLSLFLYLSNSDQPGQQRIANQLQGEFNDVETFYSDEIAKKVALIDEFGGSFANDQFTQDFEKLDAMYQVLRDEMKTRPSEKVRDALILNILVRIDLLNHQIKKLEDVKKEKSLDTSV